MAAVLGIVAGFLGPAIELVKCITEPIKRQFNYLCCFTSNHVDLTVQLGNMGIKREELQGEITLVLNNAERVRPGVRTWLEKAKLIQLRSTEIERQMINAKSDCLAVKSRYSLSRKAKKTTAAMEQLLVECSKFGGAISEPALPASLTDSLPLDLTREFESRKKMEEDIMVALQDSSVYMIGICGMGGLGKTTMAERIIRKVEKEQLFEETVKVVVGQQVDMLKIQGEMAELLGLELKEENISSRASKLHARLMIGRRILLVIDDVWEDVKLKKLIGMPCEGSCKILLTTRSRDVLNLMNVQTVLELPILSETEAWDLFRSSADARVEDPSVHSIAKKISDECKRLPIALVTVGAALRDQKDTSNWKYVLDQLKKSNPKNMPGILEGVYLPMKASYELLKSEDAKSLFLLCCLFPEDDDIPIDLLVVYAMGLRMFEDVTSLEDTRRTTCYLVDMLKTRFLLLESQRENHVRMHDIVRDVAIFIASEEKRIIKCGNDSTWISPCLGEKVELSNGRTTFPNLRFLLTAGSTDKELQIGEISFMEMKRLNVFSMLNSNLLILPGTTQLLQDLRTLCLQSCRSLNSISDVGKLVNLEIFICRDCDSIEELPLEIVGLKCLKLLEITRCKGLKKIAPGVISELDKLEELKLVESFKNWEADRDDGKERGNAGLSELESLANLTCLVIEVEDSNLAAQDISLPPNIKKYIICFGEIPTEDCSYFDHPKFNREMVLSLPGVMTLGNWTHKCMSCVEHMWLEGEGSNGLDMRQAQNVKCFHLTYCSTISSIIEICGATIVFRRLEFLELSNLNNLEEISDIDCLISEGSSSSDYPFMNLKRLILKKLPALKHLWKRGPYQDSVVSRIFRNLSSIEVFDCSSLHNLMTLSMAKDCFPQLESLEINSCVGMEHVFLCDREGNDKAKTIFPKLERLNLLILPRLTAFYHGIESIEFPFLTQMGVSFCPQFKNLVSSSRSINTGGDDEDDDFPNVLCPTKVSFGNIRRLVFSINNTTIKEFCPQIPIGYFSQLVDLRISDFPNFKSLFSFSVSQNIPNLKLLGIRSCNGMVTVIEDNDEGKMIHLKLARFLSSLI